MRIFNVKLKKGQKKQLKLICTSAVLLVLSAVLIALCEPKRYVSLLLIMPAYILAGQKTLVKATKNLFRGKLFDETFLMSIASLGALALGEYLEAVAVMLFAGIGELFESYAVSNARGAIKELAKLCPDTLNVLKDEKVVKISADQAEVGDIFVLNPGERIALDGVIISGSCSLDLSMLTGESMPSQVSVGENVPAGAINIDGTLKIKATRKASDSFAARILASVEDAASKKSKTESLITKFSLWYTPTVCALAAVTAFLLPLFFGGYGASFARFSYAALEFLVVSCPCALIISVPLTFFGSIGGAAKQGILFKSNAATQTLSKASVCILDKTGTLTNGAFSVTNVKIAKNVSKNDFWRYLYLLENGSTHPIAAAIVKKALELCPDCADGQHDCEISELRGLGRVLLSDGKPHLLAGNEKLLKTYAVKINDFDLDFAQSVVHLAKDNEYLGYVELRDEPKASASGALERLARARIRCIVLSGDSDQAVKRVADELGIKEYHSSLLPQDKLDIAEEFIAKKGKRSVIFVGDGINDAPTLSRVDVGIAMGAMGSDAAIEAADIVISDDDLSKVAKAIEISKKTLSVAKQNIAFAIGVKIAVMILCLFGIVNMWGAVFADVGVSVIAILNAMRMLKVKN